MEALRFFRALRRVLVSSLIFRLIKKPGILPKISETERIALQAGDVWIEREFFSGKPDFEKILKEPYPQLTPEEQHFLDHQVEELCSLASDWEIWRHRDLSPETWAYLKKEGFFGMIIPKEYGGLGFSAAAHSAVIQKLASRSIPLCVTAMVPNSLGPAELLIHYGTEEQRKHYLPRLARGEDMPCFALTEPNAGSDAASIQASGVVFKGTDGKLYLRLNWNKRWITLAGISTVLGLAFRLKDPERLLGKEEDRGITCALIPTQTSGVIVSQRHDPLGVPFYNCPTQGRDVVVPIDAMIGGADRAGQGWQMLMECLGAGRGISLPAQTNGGMKLAIRVVSAHATIRKQFGMSIGRFEGIQEVLARIAGFTYLGEAARSFTCGALNRDIKPPIVTAIMKYFMTELSRKAVNDAMDVQGGQGISLGPKNFLGHTYIALPIQITVEGANILTRTLMIFGQGAMRAHPYAYAMMDSLEKNDLVAFDRNFWAQIGHVIMNGFRVFWLGLTRGLLSSPARGGVTARYYQKLNWASAQFAFLTDVLMAALGGGLKARGKLTGRMADILGWMYLATATLRRFEAEGRRAEDEPLLRWSLDYALAQIQNALEGVHGEFCGRFIRWLSTLNPLGRMPSDSLDLQVAQLVQKPGTQRDRLTQGMFLPFEKEDPLLQLERAFQLTVASEAAFTKIKRAQREGKLKKKAFEDLIQDALNNHVVSQTEYEHITQADSARNQCIQVNDFSRGEYFKQPL